MADVLYFLHAYWFFLVIVFGAGVMVGWWAEGTRDAADISGWLERGHNEP